MVPKHPIAAQLGLSLPTFLRLLGCLPVAGVSTLRLTRSEPCRDMAPVFGLGFDAIGTKMDGFRRRNEAKDSCKKLLNFFVLAFFSVSASALPPPELLYRYDYRPASEISRQGFLAWGTNTDILGHLTGTTCGTEASDSAYISFGDSEQIIREAINESGDRSRHVWIYTIRATNDFFSARETLDEGLRSSDPVIRRAALLADRYGEVLVPYENEWVARGSVPVSQIVQAQEYAWSETDNRYMPIGEAVPITPDAAATHANPDPIPEFTAFPPVEVTPPRERYTVAGLFAACFCMAERPNSLARRWQQEGGGIGNAPSADCPYAKQRIPPPDTGTLLLLSDRTS